MPLVSDRRAIPVWQIMPVCLQAHRAAAQVSAAPRSAGAFETGDIKLSVEWVETGARIEPVSNLTELQHHASPCVLRCHRSPLKHITEERAFAVAEIEQVASRAGLLFFRRHPYTLQARAVGVIHVVAEFSRDAPYFFRRCVATMREIGRTSWM